MDYHMNKEYSNIIDKNKFEYIKNNESYLAIIVFSLQIYEIYSTNSWSKLQLYPIILSFITSIFFYLNSIQRNHMKPRNKYALFHGFFHISASIFMLQLLN